MNMDISGRSSLGSAVFRGVEFVIRQPIVNEYDEARHLLHTALSIALLLPNTVRVKKICRRRRLQWYLPLLEKAPNPLQTRARCYSAR